MIQEALSPILKDAFSHIEKAHSKTHPPYSGSVFFGILPDSLVLPFLPLCGTHPIVVVHLFISAKHGIK